MSLLADIVDTSARVGGASSRTVKVRELSACLRNLSADEIEIAVAYLSGDTPQGRFGLGYAALRGAAAGTSASAPSLTVGDVNPPPGADRRHPRDRISGCAQRGTARIVLAHHATGTELPDPAARG